MADISDVEQALVSSVTSTLYPWGSSQSSIIGATCRVYRGWPNSAALNLDLTAGVVNASVISDNDSGKTTTRYLPEWTYRPVVPTLTAHLTGRTIFVGGTAAVGNVIGALIDGAAFAYRVVAGDTPALVASKLCHAIQGGTSALVDGTSIHLPGATSVSVRVVSDAKASAEGRRQEKDFRIILWCPAPLTRDSTAAAIDLQLAQTPFLLLPDNSSARMTYHNTTTSDQSQNALLYRRDLVYRIEYASIIAVDLPSMLFGAANIDGHVTFG